MKIDKKPVGNILTKEESHLLKDKDGTSKTYPLIVFAYLEEGDTVEDAKKALNSELCYGVNQLMDKFNEAGLDINQATPHMIEHCEATFFDDINCVAIMASLSVSTEKESVVISPIKPVDYKSIMYGILTEENRDEDNKK